MLCPRLSVRHQKKLENNGNEIDRRKHVELVNHAYDAAMQNYNLIELEREGVRGKYQEELKKLLDEALKRDEERRKQRNG